ncbi:hypothetical protein QZH41_018650, partial [Actinostola sp. cb2023]
MLKCNQPTYMELENVAQRSMGGIYSPLCQDWTPKKSRVNQGNDVRSVAMETQNTGIDNAAITTDHEMYQPLETNVSDYQPLKISNNQEDFRASSPLTYDNSNSPALYGNLTGSECRIENDELYITVLPDPDNVN